MIVLRCIEVKENEVIRQVIGGPEIMYHFDAMGENSRRLLLPLGLSTNTDKELGTQAASEHLTNMGLSFEIRNYRIGG